MKIPDLKMEIKRLQIYKAVGFFTAVICVSLLMFNWRQTQLIEQLKIDNAQLASSIKILAEDNKLLLKELKKMKKGNPHE